MTDLFEKHGNSLIHHGKENDRIYLMKVDKDNYLDLIDYKEELAKNNEYSKILAKIPESIKDDFLNAGYEKEALIPKFYNGKEDCYFLSKYLTKDRKKFTNKNKVYSLIELASKKGAITEPLELKEGFTAKQLTGKDIPKMVKLYKMVFESYPFPIHDADYLLETMKDNIDYFGIFKGKDLVACASSEMDIDKQNTEMTDFATDPDFLGNNFSLYLLESMEKSAKLKGLKTAYTIARSLSFGMNITFAKMGYEFAGTLINNTNICGKLESMNVWYKTLV